MEHARTAAGMKINIIKDGPYRVAGGLPLSTQAIGLNEARESVEWLAVSHTDAAAPYFLCRCGQSANKPFCDGTHATVGFDGTETASRAPYAEQAARIEGAAMVLTDAESLCAGARFCDRAGTVWVSVETAASDADRAAFVRQVGQCPSGRLVARDRGTGQALEPALEPSIVLVQDPDADMYGPLWVRGGVTIVGADGVAHETRNRVTLCRCGASGNKPYCDGSHAHA